MKELPIIFQPKIVRAILDGKCSLTFRVIKPQPRLYKNFMNTGRLGIGFNTGRKSSMVLDFEEFPKVAIAWCPYGQVGDSLWVRETFALNYKGQVLTKADKESLTKLLDLPEIDIKWSPSIHMPRSASRLSLERTAPAYVKRALEITEEEARLCGFESLEDYHYYWNYLNKKRGFPFEDNIWVWGVPFVNTKYSIKKT